MRVKLCVYFGNNLIPIDIYCLVIKTHCVCSLSCFIIDMNENQLLPKLWMIWLPDGWNNFLKCWIWNPNWVPKSREAMEFLSLAQRFKSMGTTTIIATNSTKHLCGVNGTQACYNLCCYCCCCHWCCVHKRDKEGGVYFNAKH